MNIQKTQKKRKIRAVVASIAATCLLMGALAPTAASAAVGDLPVKGWDRLVGSKNADVLNGIIHTNDGCTVSVGATIHDGRRDHDGVIVKTDARGTSVWSKQPGGNGEDMLNAVIELRDGSLLAAGYSGTSADGDITDANKGYQDGLLIKYSPTGEKIWDKLIGGINTDNFSDVIATADGGFLAVGKSFSTTGGNIMDSNNGYQSLDGYVVKFDADGNIQWDNLYGSPEHEAFHTVIQTDDGGYIAAGYASSVNATNTGGEITDIGPGGLMPHDALLVKFDSKGDMVWNNLYGSTNYDEFYGIVKTPDGGCIAVGRTLGNDKDLAGGSSQAIPNRNNALAVKFDSHGDAIWNCVFAGGSYLVLKDIAAAPDGNYLTAGSVIGNANNYGQQDGFIAKISNDGVLMEAMNVGGEGYDEFSGLSLDHEGTMTAAGSSTSSQSGSILTKSNGGQDGILAHFGSSLYNVIFEENGGSDVPDQSFAFGSLFTMPDSPSRSGYTFEGWYMDPDCATAVSTLAPILQDTMFYAKWYRHVSIDAVASNEHTITGIGEPDFLIVITLPDGVKMETYAEDDGTWKIQLPVDYQLKAGRLIKAAMYDIYQDGILVSSDEELISDGNVPPDVVDPPVIINPIDPVDVPDMGDTGSTAIVALFGLLLGFMIMVAAFKGPKAYR